MNAPSRLSLLLCGVIASALLAAPQLAFAQSARLAIDKNDLYADLPFVVAVVAEGFDESPEPAQPELAIAGCKVTPLGISPNISTSIQIINGRRTDSRRVQFVMRYRIEAPKAGVYEIPSVTVTQASTSASTQPGRIKVSDVQETGDMAIELSLPDRPVWLGEMVPIQIDWFLRRDVNDHQIVVPIFDLETSFSVVAPPANGNPTLSFQAGSRELELPYVRDTVQRGNGQYTRFRFSALLAPLEAGKIVIPAAKVVASLKVGTGRDQFGFPSARLALFKASDKDRELDVRPPPLANRPPSFSGAVGTSFSIAVDAKKSVVQLGEPIELAVTIRGDARLDALALPKLDADGALPPANFSVPDEPPPGELSDDGRTKVFRVAVRVVGKDTREIPPLPFSYFDPTTATYSTVRSEPIALSVKGSAIVSAGDVVGTTRKATDQEGAGAADTATTDPAQGGSLSGADLALSAPAATLATPLSITELTPFLAAAYALPLLFFAFMVWRRRTAEDRSDRGEVKTAHRAVAAALERASRAPATETIGPLTTALRTLARVVALDSTTVSTLISELETAAFDPRAKDQPLDETLRGKVESLARDWSRRSSAPTRRVDAALLLLALGAAITARAEPATDTLSRARAEYQAALAKTDRGERTAAFARAQTLLAEVSRAHPRAPELLIDRGNAALGAGDFGAAVLAYRRALALAPGHPRASRNLSWLRANAPTWIPRPAAAGAVDSLFFWHASMSVAQRHLLGALAFALAFLLFAPLAETRRFRRVFVGVGVACLSVWAAMLSSLLLDRDGSGDAVIVADAAELRSADSPGAPLAIDKPLPGGTEVVIAELRSGWARLELPDGKGGWVAADSVERIER